MLPVDGCPLGFRKCRPSSLGYGRFFNAWFFAKTKKQDALIRQKMKFAGIENQSAFLRAMVLKGYLLKLDLPEIRELLRLLKNLTNNVNSDGETPE